MNTTSFVLETEISQRLEPARVALGMFDKHAETDRHKHYPWILSLHGLARLGVTLKESTGDETVLARVRSFYAPYLRGEVKLERCNFPNYLVGGNGAAYLWWKGELPDATEEIFAPYVDQLMNQAPRDRFGVFCRPIDPENEKIWIDVVFAVVPFLLFCGLKMNRADLVDEAWAQTRTMIERLIVPETGLVNQAINFHGAGHRTNDHWSRGNGWAMIGLTELVQYLPATHPERPAVVKMYLNFVEACVRTWDEAAGLWHQEMTDTASYVEASGSGLLLYGIGVGLELGLLGERHRAVFEAGLRAMAGYIALDGSVHHTCIGCLAPGQGAREDYMARRHHINDPHAFGPWVLAFGQAHRLSHSGAK